MNVSLYTILKLFSAHQEHQLFSLALQNDTFEKFNKNFIEIIKPKLTIDDVLLLSEEITILLSKSINRVIHP